MTTKIPREARKFLLKFHLHVGTPQHKFLLKSRSAFDCFSRRYFGYYEIPSGGSNEFLENCSRSAFEGIRSKEIQVTKTTFKKLTDFQQLISHTKNMELQNFHYSPIYRSFSKHNNIKLQKVLEILKSEKFLDVLSTKWTKTALKLKKFPQNSPLK